MGKCISDRWFRLGIAKCQCCIYWENNFISHEPKTNSRMVAERWHFRRTGDGDFRISGVCRFRHGIRDCRFERFRVRIGTGNRNGSSERFRFPMAGTRAILGRSKNQNREKRAENPRLVPCQQYRRTNYPGSDAGTENRFRRNDPGDFSRVVARLEVFLLSTLGSSNEKCVTSLVAHVRVIGQGDYGADAAKQAQRIRCIDFRCSCTRRKNAKCFRSRTGYLEAKNSKSNLGRSFAIGPSNEKSCHQRVKSRCQA